MAAPQALIDLQANFRAGVLGDDAAFGKVAGQIEADGIPALQRLNVHRNHTRTSLTEALAATFDAVVALVDARFFGFVAEAYIRANPPTDPRVGLYGAGLADFLAGHPACGQVPYVADVARLEWALNWAHFAPDVPTVAAEALAALTAEEQATLRFHYAPHVSLIASDFPVDRLLELGRGTIETADAVDLDAGPCHLIVHRGAEGPVYRSVSTEVFVFLTSVAAGQSLGAAFEEAAGHGLTPDTLGTVLTDLLQNGLIAGFGHT